MTRILHLSRHVYKRQALDAKKAKLPSNELFERYASLLRSLLSQKYFLNSKRGKWFDELAKILAFYLKDYQGAIELCEAALDKEKEPMIFVGKWSWNLLWFPGDEKSLQNRLNKLLKIPVEKQRIKTEYIVAKKVFSETGRKARYLDDESQQEMTVEDLVKTSFPQIPYF